MLPSICRHIRHAHLNCPQFNPVIPEAEKRNLSKRYGFCKTSSLLNSKLSNFGSDGIDWYWKKCVYFSRCSLGLRRMWTWTLICWKAWNALSSETESRSQAEVVCHCCLMVPGWGWGDLFFCHFAAVACCSPIAGRHKFYMSRCLSFLIPFMSHVSLARLF